MVTTLDAIVVRRAAEQSDRALSDHIERVYCGDGCGTWWYQGRGTGQRRRYLNGMHRQRAYRLIRAGKEPQAAPPTSEVTRAAQRPKVDGARANAPSGMERPAAPAQTGTRRVQPIAREMAPSGAGASTPSGHTRHCEARQKYGDGECECGAGAKRGGRG